VNQPEILNDLPITHDRHGNVIEVGARVRSFDFAPYNRDLEGERACFIEGVVEGVSREGWDCDRYVIRPTRRIAGGAERDFADDTLFFPPLNGTPGLIGGDQDGVEILA